MDPPPYLEGVEADKWRELAPKVAAVGMLTDLDVDLLAMYCKTWAQYLQHAAFVSKGGAIHVIRDESGRIRTTQISGSQVAMKQCEKTLLAIGSRFGFSPSDRVGLATNASTPKDEFSEFLSRYA